MTVVLSEGLSNDDRSALPQGATAKMGLNLGPPRWEFT